MLRVSVALSVITLGAGTALGCSSDAPADPGAIMGASGSSSNGGGSVTAGSGNATAGSSNGGQPASGGSGALAGNGV
ncbi:MAG TPA: hypothetical protein VEQ59_13840, partial [Polyangiaceae bacterium]|nr:hypothetical protein [Polyangiaceae bacterium]